MGIRGGDGKKASGRRMVAGGAAEKLPEVEAAGGEDATMGVHQLPLHAKGDITKGLAIDHQVEVVHGEGFEAFLHVAYAVQANTPNKKKKEGIGEDQEDPRSGFFMLWEGKMRGRRRPSDLIHSDDHHKLGFLSLLSLLW